MGDPREREERPEGLPGQPKIDVLRDKKTLITRLCHAIPFQRELLRYPHKANQFNGIARRVIEDILGNLPPEAALGEIPFAQGEPFEVHGHTVEEDMIFYRTQNATLTGNFMLGDTILCNTKRASLAGNILIANRAVLSYSDDAHVFGTVIMAPAILEGARFATIEDSIIIDSGLGEIDKRLKSIETALIDNTCFVNEKGITVIKKAFIKNGQPLWEGPSPQFFPFK